MHLWRLRSRLALFCWVFGATALAQQTGLIVSPTDLGLAVLTGSTTPATGVVAVVTPGQSAAFTATVRHLTAGPNWLTVNPGRGTTPSNITLSADGSNLSPGTYVAQVTIAAGGFGRVVNVALSVGSTAGSVFGVSPSALVFSAGAGVTTVPTQAITITSPAGAIGFRAVPTSSGWLTVAPLSGTTPGGVIVEAHPVGLAAGRYSGTISITPLNGGTPTVVPVTLVTAGGPAQDRLRPSQIAITVNHLFGAPSQPTGQSVTVYTNQFSSYTASTTTPWIRMTSPLNPTPVSSITDYSYSTFTAFTDPTNLSPGTYLGVITLTSGALPAVEIPVRLTISNDSLLQAQPSSVVFDELRGSTTTVSVTSTGASLTFTANPATSSGGSWLRVSPPQGSTAAGAQPLTITADTQNLLPDVYTGTVILTAQNGSTLAIPVRLEVNAVTAMSTLRVSPESFNLSAMVGDTTGPVAGLSVSVDGGVSHAFVASATSQGGWLVVDPVSSTAPAQLKISTDLSKLPAPGLNAGVIVLTSLLTGQQTLVPVNLTLMDEVLSVTPTELNFVEPRRGTLPPPQTITISAPLQTRFDVGEKPDAIRMSQYAGTTPATVQVWPAVAMLPPGTNVGVIRIIGPKNTVNVTVTYREADPAAATVTPESVTLQYQVGEPRLPTQTLDVASGGEAGRFTVRVTTESGINWLRATPLSGVTPGKVELGIEPLLLAPGRHNGTVTISVNNGTEQVKTVPVILQVGAPSAVVTSVVHSATQVPSAVAPGMMITVLGTGLGPLLGVTARPSAAGAYETRLADTRVLFDGTPAPLLFIRNDQINAIVPYSIAGRVSTTMRIEQGANWSLPLELKVVDTSPGIFTITGNGRGPASASNPDGLANTQANPADRGSVITVYATGEGQTDPPGNDGRIILSDTRKPILPVSVRIGGRDAEVLYAGSAPMQVSGMLQVNVRVPEDITPGIQPIELRVGSATSQPGVTVAVR